MEQSSQTVMKCVDILKDRVTGVQNDLLAYIYIRKNNLQHGEDCIGGGNIVVALSLFTTLNFLGKTYYCTVRPEKFDESGRAKNETETFVQFVTFLQSNGVGLGLPSNGEVLEAIWRGFRDYLAHRLTVEPGKSVLTFQFEPGHQGSIKSILTEAKQHAVFEYDEGNKNWIVNGDALLAFLPDIVSATVEHILTGEHISTNLLPRVVGIE